MNDGTGALCPVETSVQLGSLPDSIDSHPGHHDNKHDATYARVTVVRREALRSTEGGADDYNDGVETPWKSRRGRGFGSKTHVTSDIQIVNETAVAQRDEKFTSMDCRGIWKACVHQSSKRNSRL